MCQSQPLDHTQVSTTAALSVLVTEARRLNVAVVAECQVRPILFHLNFIGKKPFII